jgi:hypothetical protein
VVEPHELYREARPVPAAAPPAPRKPGTSRIDTVR